MPIRKLDLYDLLGPQFQLGFSFPDYIDRVLSLLAVDEFETTYDDALIIYVGTLVLNGDGEGGAFEQEQPGGTSFSWNGNRFPFRMTVSRDATNQINDVINPAGNPPTANSDLDNVVELLQDLRPASEPDTDRDIAHPNPAGAFDETVTDYPGFAFKLELLVDVLNFSLGQDWKPGKLDPASHRVIAETSPTYVNKRVNIVLPRAVLEYRQGANLGEDVQFAINSWGGAGIDSAHDLKVGNFISMDPQIALHASGQFAFSVDQIMLDLSTESTPPAILQHFGTSEDFTGLYFGQMLVYYSNDQGVGFNLRVNDALISFAGEVSLEGALDVFLNQEVTSLRVETKIFTGNEEKDFTHGIISAPASPPSVTSPSAPPGRATVTQNSVLTVDISGGHPPYTIRVFRGSSDVWQSAQRRAVFDTIGTDQRYLVYVEDSLSPTPRKYAEWLNVNVQRLENDSSRGGTGTPQDRNPSPDYIAAVLTPVSGFTAQHRLDHVPARSGLVERLTVAGNRAGDLTISRGGGLPDLTKQITNQDRDLSFSLPQGASYNVAFVAPATSPPAASLEVTFTIDKPYTAAELANYRADVNALTLDNSDPLRPRLNLPASPASGDPQFVSQLARFNAWLPHLGNLTGTTQVDGFASYRTNLSHDQKLSENRAAVGAALLTKLASLMGISTPTHTVQANSNQNYAGSGSANGPTRTFQAFRITGSFTATTAINIQATIGRGTPPTPPTVVPPPTPERTGNPPPNEMPTVIRRLGFRVRFERNTMVLLELNGKVDFETAMEQQLRTASGNSAGALALRNGNGNQNNEDGVVDFKVLYTYNTATSEYGVGLALGSDPGDTDGLVHLQNGTGPQSDAFKNIFGALMIFAPIINAAAVNTADNSEDAGAWLGLGASLAVPVAIGALGIVRTRRVVLYGGELMVKFSEPGAPGPNSIQVAIMFDYGVEFDLVVPSIGIGADRNVANATAPPLKVRYKAIGFQLHHHSTTGGLDYTPIFDPSKGYDLNLTDPSLFSLPAPLGNLFGVTAARLARFNPLTLEIDLSIKADLGVITVDKFKIKIPLDGDGNVQIMPSGVKVNIPGTLVGNGFVNIVDGPVTQPDGSTITAKGIEGGLDLTIVPVKLRIAGSVGVTSLRDNNTGREGVGVFVGLRVEFPSPIVLGASGLGLYGIMGLFAMHYRRLEDPAQAADPIGPALRWLVKADGDPTQLRNAGGQALWGPSFDRWSFGVGVILGTMDTGFTANFQGMFVLELPGPRILIMVKMKFISVKPEGVDSDAAQLTTGIIAVIDLDFEQQKITIGVLIDFEIEEVLQLKIPIEILFKLDDPSHWHFWLGTYAVPVSANILNMVRGSAYFMIQGHELTFPGQLPYVPSSAPILNKTLQGVAIALGMEASLLFGSRPARLYLEIGAGFHVGLSFSPFILVGSMFFRGELRLFIISIGASGTLDVEITRLNNDPFYIYIHGEVCGKVDFFFFSVSACIDITIERGVRKVQAPPLINGVYLQSYAPVLLSGQGGDRPIDASLGNAAEGRVTTDLPVVPIDTVPVIQFYASPVTSGTTTFTEPLGTSPDLRPGGWVRLSEETKIRYELLELSLIEQNGSAYNDPDPVPATWRKEDSGSGLNNEAHKSVDLALFSRVPTTAARALERSSELNRRIEVQWENLCKKPAPPASVFFHFCGQPLGPSPSGWTLTGCVKPDPDDSLREGEPDDQLIIREPQGGSDAWQNTLEAYGLASKADARVVGIPVPPGRYTEEIDYSHRMVVDGQKPEKTCIDFTEKSDRHPLLDWQDELVVKRDRSLRRLRENVFRPVDETTLTPRERLEAILKPELPTQPPPNRISIDPRGPVIDPAILREIRSTPTLDPGMVMVNPGPTIRFPGRLNPDIFLPGSRDTIEHEGVSIKDARIIDFGNTRGVEFGKLSIQFKESVCRIDLRVVFRGEGTYDLAALNAKGERITGKEGELLTSGMGTAVLTIEAEGIYTLVVSFRKVKGVITQLCYYRNCNKGLEKMPHCYRALQFPYPLRQHDRTGDALLEQNQELAKILQEYLLQNPLECLLDLETGAVEYLHFYIAVFIKFQNHIMVQELDEEGKVLHEAPLRTFLGSPVSSASDFPSDWLDPVLPWRNKVIEITRFLHSDFFKAYEKHVFTFKPKNPEKCVRVRFVTTKVSPNVPPMYLAAVERLHLSEAEQVAHIEAVQQTQLDTLEGYLGHGESDRPLLKPNRVYHLIAKYKAKVESVSAKGIPHDHEETITQEFSFRTDNVPPPELKPYVLGTTPEMDEEYHFFNDPLKVIFNDRGTLEMYQAYGKQLRGVIRKADGGAVNGSPDAITALAGQAAEVLTPYREAVENLIAAGILPCASGSVMINEHGLYEAPFQLQPSTPYTFDIEVLPTPPPADGASVVPPFRRAFKTSQFADLADFAQSINTLPVHSMALTQPLAGLPAAGSQSSRPDVAFIDDAMLESVLTAAGMTPQAGANKTGIWQLWEVAGAGFRPRAILIDAAEPMWKDRVKPEKKSVQDGAGNVIDPAFQIWETGREASLELLEASGSNHVDYFVRSTSGTRCLVLLDPTSLPSSGSSDLTLNIQQPGNGFYGLTNKQEPLITITLNAKAPWEE
ncbi:hypothetical protein [Lewinella sp. W8]|uniref:hypothetical protein n=1 Tax=Lewinella sp. W8 TaxID=2528208 RepID=UPI001067DF77|nr:hypothetical protein [Lewinella sp. W8]MTB50414.1 hypothetical protein [Lewinella sp. W8]